MAVKCMNIIDNNTALHKAVVELFADTKIEVTSDMEIRDFPPGYEIEMGSILTTGDFNVAVMGSDGIWKWEENSGSKTAFNGELVYDGTILEGYKVSVKVPSGITKIGDNAFKNLTGLENVNITEGVTLIGDYAFYGCTDLKTVKIASTVTGIGDSAFEGCTGLETVYCEPTTPPSLGTDAFDGITSGCTIYVPDASYVAYATSWSDMTDYLLPEGGTVEVTVTGNPISMSDAVAHNAISTILSYSPKQSGTGDPSPSNVRPITGWTEASLTGAGKNLFDLSTLATTGITYADGVLTGTANAFNSAYSKGIPYDFSFLKNARIAIACEAKVQTASGTNNGLRIGITYTDGTYYSFSWKNNDDSYARRYFASEEGKSVSGIYITYNSNGSNVWLIRNFQIEVSSQATDYEPYITPTTTTISLGGTYYGFEIDVERGVLTVEWVEADLSTLTRAYNSGLGCWACTLPSDQKASYAGTSVIPDVLDSIRKPVSYYSPKADNRISVSPNGNLLVGNNSSTEQPTEKAYYKLATPIELPLTPKTVALLAGANTLWTEGDSVALSYLAIASQHQEPTPLLGLTSFSRGISDEEGDPDTIEEPIEEEFIENLEENSEEDIIDIPVEEETTENDER